MEYRIGVFIFYLLCTYAVSETCVTPLGRNSQCLSIYDCAPLSAAFDQTPLSSSVISFLRESSCGFERHVPRVCCGPLPTQSQERATTSRPQPTQPPIITGEVDPVSSEDSSPAPRGQCGIENDKDRIYGGIFTELDEFPWMVLMGYRTTNGSLTYQCGGVLINHRYVLTAAHCVTGSIETAVGTLATVRLGEYDIETTVDCIKDDCADPPQEIPVHSAYPHPGFSDQNKNRRDDIAVVRLSRRAKYSYYVKPICLVDTSARLDVGNDVYVAGWGKTLDGRNSPVKLKLKVPVYSKNNCKTKYRTLGADLTDKQICAGGVFAEDACRGDSGGPLMRKNTEGVWDTVAVVSFGYGCGRDGWPGVYTSVASYVNWIRSTLQSSNNN